MNAREQRLARNEALFREVNERIADVSSSYELGDSLEFLCECGSQDCRDAISIVRADYERVRSEPDRFVVMTGHESLEIERVLERRDGYLVVAKIGEAGAIAEETDPRS
ncbi:MAG: hypothetical protein ACRDM9_10815 [Gaiellaceae bacterium]